MKLGNPIKFLRVSFPNAQLPIQPPCELVYQVTIIWTLSCDQPFLCSEQGASKEGLYWITQKSWHCRLLTALPPRLHTLSDMTCRFPPLGRSIYLCLLPFLPSTQVSVKIAHVIESQIVGKGKHLTVEGQIQCRNVVAPGYSDLATRCPCILPRLIAAKCSTIAQLPGPQGHKEEKRWQASQLQKPCLQRAVSALRHRQGLKNTSELGTGTCSRNMWLCHGQPVELLPVQKKCDSLSKWQSQPVELRNKSVLSEIRKQQKPVSQSLETDWLSFAVLAWAFSAPGSHTWEGRWMLPLRIGNFVGNGNETPKPSKNRCKIIQMQVLHVKEPLQQNHVFMQRSYIRP